MAGLAAFIQFATIPDPVVQIGPYLLLWTGAAIVSGLAAALEMSEEVRRQVVQMIGSSLTEGELDKPAPADAEGQPQQSPIETSIELASTTPATPTEETQSKGGMAPR